ncbi:isocitrate/isopropylmalate dehydrogenase family protein [Paenarthrobacter sp. NPDC091711]|uniref:isocitrate/isopropylmalate dehydrogenase family protein n=1 Tax=Paenarthrobacter sp. NPDC091711 TaxID=3364385 RepID=UPI0038262F1B
MSDYRVVTLPGDGIGPEIMDVAVAALNKASAAVGGLQITIDEHDASAGRWQRTGAAMSEETFEACRDADAILMGAIGLPEARHPDGREVNGDVIFRLRFALDLYAGVRPVRSLPGVRKTLATNEPIDYVVVRENVEGLYASRTGGTNVRNEVATDTIVITDTGTRKVSKVAFDIAMSRKGRPLDGRRMVSCIDKANVLSSYAFFRSVFDDAAKAYPEIATDHVYVDAMTAFQVQRPAHFDVVVAENMFGDIISDLAAATVGGLGMAASGDIGDKHGMFQPAHGSAPDIAGRNLANPAAMVLSTAMMLDWMGRRNDDDLAVQAGQLIDAAVLAVLAEGTTLTADLGGSASCSEMGEAIVAAITAAR